MKKLLELLSHDIMICLNTIFLQWGLGSMVGYKEFLRATLYSTKDNLPGDKYQRTWLSAVLLLVNAINREYPPYPYPLHDTIQ